ncbi:MAG TPA: hypothetical protein V6C81_25755 [Planktothrix sp.]|jgi:hypothetical protein
MSPQDSIIQLLKDGIKNVEARPDWMEQLKDKERVVKDIVNQQHSERPAVRSASSIDAAPKESD